jgi:septin 7
MTDYSYEDSRTDSVYENGPSQPSYASQGNGVAKPAAIQKKPMGFVGFSNLPNQVHRKSVRKGFQFTAMVVGMSLF